MGFVDRKPVIRVSNQVHAQPSLLSYRDWLESGNFACIKLGSCTFMRVNSKSTDQTGRMGRLVYAFAFLHATVRFSLDKAKIIVA